MLREGADEGQGHQRREIERENCEKERERRVIAMVIRAGEGETE